MITNSKKLYISDLKKRISREMPKVLEEIKTYEDKLRNGQLTQNPKAAPQFNG